MLGAHKLVSRKNDLLFGLRKNTKFDAKNKAFYDICFVFFTLTT
jgi:hypothetical protein